MKRNQKDSVAESSTSNAEELQRRFWDLLSSSSVKSRGESCARRSLPASRCNKSCARGESSAARASKETRHTLGAEASARQVTHPASFIQKKPMSTYEVLFKDLEKGCGFASKAEATQGSRDDAKKDGTAGKTSDMEKKKQISKQISEELMSKVARYPSTGIQGSRQPAEGASEGQSAKTSARIAKLVVTETVNKPVVVKSGSGVLSGGLSAFRRRETRSAEQSVAEGDAFSTENDCNRSFAKFKVRSVEEASDATNLSEKQREPRNSEHLQSFVVKNRIDESSPFSSYSPKNEAAFRSTAKTAETLSVTATADNVSTNDEGSPRGVGIYAPGQLLRVFPRLRIAQVHITEGGLRFIFEVMSDVRWFVVKELRALRDLTRKISRDVMESLEPEKIRLRKELVEIYVNSSLSRDSDKMQFFILTGVVAEYAPRTDHLLVKDKEWIVVKGRVLNRNLVLYSGQVVYRIFCLDNTRPEILSETMFGIASRGASICFNTFSTAERNAWIEYLAESK